MRTNNCIFVTSLIPRSRERIFRDIAVIWAVANIHSQRLSHCHLKARETDKTAERRPNTVLGGPERIVPGCAAADFGRNVHVTLKETRRLAENTKGLRICWRINCRSIYMRIWDRILWRCLISRLSVCGPVVFE